MSVADRVVAKAFPSKYRKNIVTPHVVALVTSSVWLLAVISSRTPKIGKEHTVSWMNMQSLDQLSPDWSLSQRKLFHSCLSFS